MKTLGTLVLLEKYSSLKHFSPGTLVSIHSLKLVFSSVVSGQRILIVGFVLVSLFLYFEVNEDKIFEIILLLPTIQSTFEVFNESHHIESLAVMSSSRAQFDKISFRKKTKTGKSQVYVHVRPILKSNPEETLQFDDLPLNNSCEAISTIHISLLKFRFCVARARFSRHLKTRLSFKVLLLSKSHRTLFHKIGTIPEKLF